MDKTSKFLVGFLGLMVLGLAWVILQSFPSSPKVGDSGYPQFFSSATMGSAAVSSATSTKILAVNNVRTYASLCNDSAAKVYLSFGGAAVTTSGYVMAANSCFVINQDVFLGQINGIAASGTSTVITIEK